MLLGVSVAVQAHGVLSKKRVLEKNSMSATRMKITRYIIIILFLEQRKKANAAARGLCAVTVNSHLAISSR